MDDYKLVAKFFLKIRISKLYPEIITALIYIHYYQKLEIKRAAAVHRVSLEFCLTLLYFKILSLFSLSEESKFHSVWLLEFWNSFMRVYPNTCEWEHQE